jgi:hypothetical protein
LVHCSSFALFSYCPFWSLHPFFFRFMAMP